jgi:serine/threonine-protein kinase RsbW
MAPSRGKVTKTPPTPNAKSVSLLATRTEVFNHAPLVEASIQCYNKCTLAMQDIMRRISVVVPCDLQYRDYVGALLVQLCREVEEKGEPRPFCHQVISAFNEAFNNLAIHGKISQPIRIVIDLTDKRLIIEFHHDGESFKVESVKTPDLNDVRESGMGLFIMTSFMHKIEYASAEGDLTKVLRMTRYLNG